MTNMIKKLPENDKFRIDMTECLLKKLYQAGLINSKDSLEKA